MLHFSYHWQSGPFPPLVSLPALLPSTQIVLAPTVISSESHPTPPPLFTVAEEHRGLEVMQDRVIWVDHFLP